MIWMCLIVPLVIWGLSVLLLYQASSQLDFIHPVADVQDRASYILQQAAAAALKDSSNRGIVLCLYDNIVPLGVSLILELRCLGNFSPIEVCYCTESELSATSMELLRQDPLVTLVDSCSSFADQDRVVKSFQSYWIKPLALLNSRFDQVMLLDADTIFMENPAALWSVEGYKRTGTLFFPDRIMTPSKFLGKKVQDPTNATRMVPWIHAIFQLYGSSSPGIRGAKIKASDQLKQSPLWDQKSGHYQDSSVVLFDKVRQQKAAKVMEHFVFKERFQHSGFSWVSSQI